MRLSDPSPDDIWDTALEECPLVHARFPHVVTLGHLYPDMDRTHRWCWITFGARQGKCNEAHSEFPACPLVLVRTQFVIPDDPEDEPRYETVAAVPDHSHFGTWTTLWLGKTDYDYGNEDYCFSTAQQKALFLAYVSLIAGGQ